MGKKTKSRAARARKGGKGGTLRVLLLRTARPGVAFWPDDRPFELPGCQVIAPLGIIQLASVIRGALGTGVELRVEDLATAVKDEDGILPFLEEARPDVLGLSSLTLEAERAARVVAAAREADESTLVVLGGPYPTLEPEAALRESGADAAVLGEAENTVLPLLAAIAADGDIGAVPGLAVPGDDGTVRVAPPPPAVDPLDSLPLPAWDMIPIETYSRMYNQNGLPILHPPYAPITTSRGCPYRCSFCHNLFGKRFRAHGAGRVLEEIELLHDRHGVRELHIIDDIFNFDRGRVRRICEGIIRRGLGIGLSFPNGLRGDRLTREDLGLLRKAGAYSITLSLESASPRILKLMNKRMDLEKFEEAARIAGSLGIVTKCIFIAGYPGETREEMKATLRWVRDSSVDIPQISIACPLPRTEMARQAAAVGAVVDFPRELMNFNDRHNLTAMTQEEFDRTLADGIAEILAVPRRQRRLKEIRGMWGPEVERYFDWTLDRARAERRLIRGEGDSRIASDLVNGLVETLRGQAAPGCGWRVKEGERGVILFRFADGSVVRLLVTRRDDSKPRLAFTRRYNIAYVPGPGSPPIHALGGLLDAIVGTMQHVDP